MHNEKIDEEVTNNVTDEEIQNTHTEEVKGEEIEQEERLAQKTTDLVDSNIENLSKTDAVALLIKKAKILVDEADNKLNDCQAVLKNDLQDYENAKATLKSTVISVNSDLLKQLDYQQEQLEELEAMQDGEQYGDELAQLNSIEDSIEIFNKDDFKEASPYEIKNTISPMYVQEPSSGKFGGFILGLIGGGATLAGMAYFASTKLGIKLDPSKIPSMETCKPIFEWYSKLVGQTDPNIGMGIMGGSALLVLWIIYAIKKSSKASKNLEFAKNQLNQSEAYSQQKFDCKVSMDELDKHMQDAIDTFKLYDVMLNEEQAKLNRIMFIEADKIANGDFHEKSLKEIEDTRSLVEAVKDYISIPMVDEEGKLSEDISKSLADMKVTVDKLITRLY